MGNGVGRRPYKDVRLKDNYPLDNYHSIYFITIRVRIRVRIRVSGRGRIWGRIRVSGRGRIWG